MRGPRGQLSGKRFVQATGCARDNRGTEYSHALEAGTGRLKQQARCHGGIAQRRAIALHEDCLTLSVVQAENVDTARGNAAVVQGEPGGRAREPRRRALRAGHMADYQKHRPVWLFINSPPDRPADEHEMPLVRASRSRHAESLGGRQHESSSALQHFRVSALQGVGTSPSTVASRRMHVA